MATSVRVHTANDFLGSLTALMNVIDDALAAAFRRELGDDFSMSRYLILRVIARTRSARVADLAAYLNVSTAAVSKRVERLVRDRLVERVAIERDRRARSLCLTGAGEALLARYEAIHEKAVREVFAKQSAETLACGAILLDHLSMDIMRPQSERSVCLRCGVHMRDTCLLRQVPAVVCRGRLRTMKLPGGEESP